MNKVKVLIEGYADRKEGNERATSTTTLIYSGDIKIIVDPGMNRKKLLDALNKESLKPSDIDYVVLSHTHMDHMLLTGIFENAKVLDDSSIYSFDGSITDHEGVVPNTNVKIISTPGHDPFECTVLVKTEDKGVVAVAADVFWWWDDETQKNDKTNLMKQKDVFVKDLKKLEASRRKVLELADWIIPGHGKMFKVEK